MQKKNKIQKFYIFLKKNNILDKKIKNIPKNFFLDSMQFVNVISFLETIDIRLSKKDFARDDVSSLNYILKKIQKK